MKIIDRYLSNEILWLFLLAVGAVVIIGIADVVYELVDKFINQKVPFLIILKLLVFFIPKILVHFFPMATLFAVVLVLIRMAKDNEITVLRAMGINLWRVIFPIVCMAIIFSLASFINNEFIVPWSNHKTYNILRKIQLKTPMLGTEDMFSKQTFFLKDSEGRILFVKNLDKERNLLKDIIVYDITEENTKIISAEIGIQNNDELILEKGIIHFLKQDGHLSHEIKFDTTTIYFDKDVYSFYGRKKRISDMNSKEIKAKIKLFRNSGIRTNKLEVEYYDKFAAPFSSFIFACLGIFFCFTFVKNSKEMWGIIIVALASILCSGFFLTLTAVFRALGRGPQFPPLLAVWMPNILFALISISVLLKKANN